ncbi:MAG: MFS transporter [Chloroflexi bacterium]|nr:MFS transporter [Chloroflexota bacterium]
MTGSATGSGDARAPGTAERSAGVQTSGSGPVPSDAHVAGDAHVSGGAQASAGGPVPSGAHASGGARPSGSAQASDAAQPPSGALVALAVLMAATTLRPALVVLGPLASRIASDLGVSYGEVGFITTMALLLVAVTSPLGPWAIRAFGVRRAMVVTMLGLGVLGVCRAIAPGLEIIVLVSGGVGALIGLGQSLPPSEARAAGLSPRIGSAAFTSGLVGSSVVATLLAVPLADAFGGWRAALLVLAVPAFVAVPIWLLGVPGRRVAGGGSAGRPALPWRDRGAWGLAVAFGLQSAVYQCLMAWLPAILAEQGWSEATAGGAVGVLNVIALGASLVLLFGGSSIPHGTGSVLAVAIMVLGAVMVLAVQGPAVAAVLLAGAGLGAILPLLVGLALARSSDARTAGGMTAFMFLVGFAIAAVAPTVLGVGRDRTGDFGVSLWLLVGVAAALVVVCAAIRWPMRRRTSD